MREGEIQIVPKGRNEEALALLPIDRLHFLVNPLSPPLPEEEVAAGQAISILMLLGIRTLGQFARIPSAGIGPRFGKQGVELHRRARGEGHFPFRPFEATESFIESHSFLEAVSDIEPVLFVAKGLLAKLEAKLDRKLKAVTELRMVLETEDSEEIEMVIPLLRPLKREKSLLPLIREKLSNVALVSPLHSFSIELSLPVQSTGSQFHLFDSREENSEQLDELLGRLVAGLGPSFISAAALRERYRPEKSWEKVTFEPFQRDSKPLPFPAVLFKRPSVIVNPQPLQAERRGGVLCLRSPSEKFEVTRLVGPERLAGEWWDEASHERDYFRAETKTGQHLWIFKPLCEASTSFFLHGYFD